MAIREMVQHIVSLIALTVVLLPQSVVILPGDASAGYAISASPKGKGVNDFYSIKSPYQLPRAPNIFDSQHTGVNQIGTQSNAPNLYIDLRDHGLDPEIAIVLIGQTVVWTNKGTQNHTVTQESPTSAIYLPIILRSAGIGGSQSVTTPSINMAQTPLFDSGKLVPGEQFTYTFNITGTFSYFSANSPGKVIGQVIVVKPDEIMAKPVVASTGISITTTNGLGIEIIPSGLVTDTILTISSISASSINNTPGITTGMFYNIEINGFDIISSPITLTFSYDSAYLPEGVAEGDLRVFYFNGLDWIGIPSIVDTNRNVATANTNHLSFFGLFPDDCKDAFNHEFFSWDRDRYEAARDYFKALSTHRDLFEKIEYSEGKLFEVRADEAEWLSEQTLCELEDKTRNDIWNNIYINAEPIDVARAMVDIGAELLAQEYDETRALRTYERLTKGDELVSLGLELIEIVDGANPIHVLAKDIIAGWVEDIVVRVINDLDFDIHYTGELQNRFQTMNNWISQSAVQPVGQSDLNLVPADEPLNNQSGSCTHSWSTDKGFYQVESIYNPDPSVFPDIAYGFTNLYQEQGEVNFVVGLQDLGPLRFASQWPLGTTDYIIVLLEYEDNSTPPQKRIARMLLQNGNFLTFCVTGKMELPDIRPGSRVKVAYYLIEDGDLDKRFSSNGVHHPFPVNKGLYYVPTVIPNPAWQEVGTSSATGSGISNNGSDSKYPSIAIDTNGTPYVTWQDNTSGDYEIYVRRWNGTSWEEVGTGSASGGGISNNNGTSDGPSVAFAPDSTPYVSWTDDTNGDKEIYVRRWNGTSWEEVGTGSASGGGISDDDHISVGSSIAIAPDGSPYITWTDWVCVSCADEEIYVRRWNGTSWEEVGAASASGGGISNNIGHSTSSSIAIAPDDTPYVAWMDYSSGFWDIYTRRWNGTGWEEVGTGSASGGGVSNNSGDHAYDPSIAITSNGVPYIAWNIYYIGAIYVRRWNGTSWEEVGTGSASGGGISNNSGNSRGVSVAIAPDSIPYIAWYDNSSGDWEIYVRRWTE